MHDNIIEVCGPDPCLKIKWRESSTSLRHLSRAQATLMHADSVLSLSPPNFDHTYQCLHCLGGDDDPGLGRFSIIITVLRECMC